MTSEQFEKFEELGRRAVACERWRWMPGMLAVHHQDYGNNGLDGRVIEIDDKEGPMWIGWGDLYLPLFEGSWPDLRDPATLGCLLALVREAWPGCYAEPNGAPEWDGIIERERDSWWRVYGFGRIPRPLGYGPTEAGALVAALEAAP